ncbi:IS1380 family transposase [Bradyrhizobium sp.]|uniref:IS1380 family transposase n=1 Tax=Bradyrhizobium sp. TaxID=376 RepID=UPI001EC73EE3|nr:IS1380 family transposase [Bradyrhizobium sp.]MBV9981851.1 IS1380 family transposase [Bradyrhizobium sp.]
MPTECSAEPVRTERFEFGPVDGRAVVAGFDGGAITSDAGALLLGTTDRAIGLVGRFAECFIDGRRPELVEHAVPTLVGQRVFGIALGYEDINDHDELRHDPVMAMLAGKLQARRADCAPVAGKSTLNRLELSRDVATRYHKIAHHPAAIEALFVTLFLEAYRTAPKEIILDLDATDDPLHGHQEGRFFHGYHDCYCYLPLYIFCGRHLLAAKLRPANIDASAGSVEEIARIVAQIRQRWPHTRIILRADSGFARDALMSWCEANGVDFIFGLAKNVRLVRAIGTELVEAREENQATGQPARRFKELIWTTRKSWSRQRRVIAKAEWTKGEANPRFIVTSLTSADGEGRHLYEAIYCARGEMENRIKECQMDLFADRTSSATMKANQLRLWFASMAYVLLEGLRRIALRASDLADASCGTIRRKLLKIGALVTISVRRVKFAMASGCPSKATFATAHRALVAAVNTS